MGTTNNWPGFSGAVLHAPSQRGEAAGAAEPTKLEDFFGVQHEPATAPAASGRRPFGAGGASSTIGLSMIKNWLRSQPALAAAVDDKMAIVAVLPEGDETVVASGAVVETAQQEKAATETFGQRTSVYRGVTKYGVHLSCAFLPPLFA
jgi:AP2-like factor, ANT lineage